jgi:hypothetical protein
MQKLILKKIGKKTYYSDPLKHALRNIENPKDIWMPNTKRTIGKMLDKVAERDTWI